MNRKRVFGSVARIFCVLQGFGRDPGVAGRPGGAGLWSRWGPLKASGGLWGPLGASGGLWVLLGTMLTNSIY